MKLSNYILKLNKKFDDKECVILYSTRTSGHVVIDVNLYDILLKRDFQYIDEKTYSLLVKNKFLIDDDEEELQSILNENINYIQNSSDLTVVLQPTDSCQMGCHYCGQSHSKNKYSDLDIDKIVDFILNQVIEKKYHSITLGLFGAEPLLAQSEIIKILTKLRESLGSQFKINTQLVTNGLSLKKEFINYLNSVSNLISIDITIDGIKEVHNTRRPIKKSNYGSFDVIINNIRNCYSSLSSETLLKIRSNIDDENIESMENLIDFFTNEEWSSKAVFNQVPVYSWGNDAHKRIEDRREFAVKYFELKKKFIGRGLKVDPFISKRTLNTCAATSNSALVIDPYLNIYSCTEVSLVDVYKEKTHETFCGNIKNDIHSYKLANYSNFYGEISQKEFPCYQCVYLPACGGACPKLWKEGIPACPIQKEILPEIIEYLTELKIGK